MRAFGYSDRTPVSYLAWCIFSSFTGRSWTPGCYCLHLDGSPAIASAPLSILFVLHRTIYLAFKSMYVFLVSLFIMALSWLCTLNRVFSRITLALLSFQKREAVCWNKKNSLMTIMSFPNGSVGKESTCNAGNRGDGFNSWVRKIPRRRKWQPMPVFLPGKSHRQRSGVGYSPKGCKELEMTDEQATIMNKQYCLGSAKQGKLTMSTASPTKKSLDFFIYISP